MILADFQISHLASNGMLSPFVGESVKGPGGTSYGLSSYGYDVRVSDEWVIYKDMNWLDSNEPLDPADVQETDTLRIKAPQFIIRPGGFVLAHTVETFSFPRDVTGFVKDKSSLARVGIHLQNTVLEAGWSGQVTLEIYNNGPRPVLLRAGQGIAQVLFHRGKECVTSYADRRGKYQGQAGVTLSKGV